MDLLDDSKAGDESSMWDEVPEFTVETCPRDCVSVNRWDRDPVYEDPEGLYESECSDNLCEGSRGLKRDVCLW